MYLSVFDAQKVFKMDWKDWFNLNGNRYVAWWMYTWVSGLAVNIYFVIFIDAQMNLIFKIPLEEIFQTKEGACFWAMPAKTIDHVNFWLISNTLSKITDPKHKYPDSLQTKSCEREWKWFQKVWMRNWTYEWTDKETFAILNKVSEQVNDAMRLIRRERNFSKNIKRVKLRLMHFGGGIRTGRLIWPKRSCQLKAQLNKLITWKMSVSNHTCYFYAGSFKCQTCKLQFSSLKSLYYQESWL